MTGRASSKTRRAGLLDMNGDQLGHLEHRYLLFSSENHFQSSIGIDEGLFLFVLKFVFLDVIPELLSELATGDRGGSYDSCERVVGLHRFHQGGVRLAGSGLFGFRHNGLLVKGSAPFYTEVGLGCVSPLSGLRSFFSSFFRVFDPDDFPLLSFALLFCQLAIDQV